MANVKDDDEESLEFADEGEYVYDPCVNCDGDGCDQCGYSGERQPDPKYRLNRS